MATPASSTTALLAQLNGKAAPVPTAPAVEETEEETLIGDEAPEVEETDAEEETDEAPEEELSDSVKEILKKNRDTVRLAEKRAEKAERLLAAKGEVAAEVSEADTRYRDLYIQGAAKGLLTEAGLSSGAERMLKLVDFESVTVDEDGVVTGLDSQIEEIKEEFPDLFVVAKAATKRTPKVDAAPRKGAETKPKDSASTIADRLLGR